MLQWYPVVSFPVEHDLSPFLRYLHGRQLLSRVTEEHGQQQLWISDHTKVLEVAQAAERWAAGQLEISEPEVDAVQPRVNPRLLVTHLVHLVPVTLIFISLGIIGYLLVLADRVDLRYAEPFLFQARQYGFALPLSEGLSRGQYWRLLTPMFLHFSWLHVVFNAIVLWQLGQRIERVKGSGHFLLIVLLTGLFANVAQYMAQANAVFGGLSGVVYGLIGYIAVYQRHIKHPVLQFNESLIFFFIVWLLLGVFGVIDFLIPGSIANAAHIGGLLSGAMIASVVVQIDKANTNK